MSMQDRLMQNGRMKKFSNMKLFSLSELEHHGQHLDLNFFLNYPNNEICKHQILGYVLSANIPRMEIS